jgi:hypothetical protein
MVDGPTANEYKKITYNWGGIFYKKNDLDITDGTFKKEAKE